MDAEKYPFQYVIQFRNSKIIRILLPIVMSEFIKIKSISQLHKMLGDGKPRHPAVSVVNNADIQIPEDMIGKKVLLDFYVISFKSEFGEFKYGRNYYDFEEGTLIFLAPGQVITEIDPHDKSNASGWSLYFHPDLVMKSELGRKMNNYSFFSYEANEALHLSDEEKETVFDCMTKIKKEYSQNIDKHSHALIVSNLELLLNYCTRFYDRQFYTRTTQNQDIVTHMESLLKNYFNSDKPLNLGIPTVKYCAAQVNLSPNYLSDLLKKETGKNTKEHIDYYLIQKAKSLLMSTNSSIGEIAYDLGFEYPRYFSKLFKKKTGMTPVQFKTLN